MLTPHTVFSNSSRPILSRIVFPLVVMYIASANAQEPAGTPLPTEVRQTRANLDFWLENMRVDHGFTLDEMAQVCGLPSSDIEARISQKGWRPRTAPSKTSDGRLRVLPYPGGRHPRIGFLEGAIDPQRGTKASIFLPWDDAGYVVLDIPEAIFSNLGLTFLAHTHVPTLWEAQNVQIENVDWQVADDGALRHEWALPNGIRFGAEVAGKQDHVALLLWLENGTTETLTGLRTQICLMLKGAPDFNAQEETGRTLEKPVAAIKAKDKEQWILVAFEHCGRVWGNTRCPCIHSDPVLPDAPPGARVSARGRISFHEGPGVEEKIHAAANGWK